MNRGIYATATGMLAGQKLMDVVANNLANANTTGFKRDGLTFNETLEREFRTQGGRGAAIGTVGSGAIERTEYTVFEMGGLVETGNPFHVAINSRNGLFAVQTGPGANDIRYTRDGAFSIDEQGVLVTKDRKPILDADLRPIQIPEGELRFAADGTITVDDREVGRLGIFDGVWRKEGSNLYQGTRVVPIEEPNVVWRSLESSNVNPVESMIQMVNVGRTFEMAQRSIQSQDDLLSRLIQSLNDRS